MDCRYVCHMVVLNSWCWFFSWRGGTKEGKLSYNVVEGVAAQKSPRKLIHVDMDLV